MGLGLLSLDLGRRLLGLDLVKSLEWLDLGKSLEWLDLSRRLLGLDLSRRLLGLDLSRRLLGLDLDISRHPDRDPRLGFLIRQLFCCHMSCSRLFGLLDPFRWRSCILLATEILTRQRMMCSSYTFTCLEMILPLLMTF